MNKIKEFVTKNPFYVVVFSVISLGAGIATIYAVLKTEPKDTISLRTEPKDTKKEETIKITSYDVEYRLEGDKEYCYNIYYNNETGGVTFVQDTCFKTWILKVHKEKSDHVGLVATNSYAKGVDQIKKKVKAFIYVNGKLFKETSSNGTMINIPLSETSISTGEAVNPFNSNGK
jgi:exopolysaccharide biosynthesis protein